MCVASGAVVVRWSVSVTVIVLAVAVMEVVEIGIVKQAQLLDILFEPYDRVIRCDRGVETARPCTAAAFTVTNSAVSDVSVTVLVSVCTFVIVMVRVGINVSICVV